VKEQAFGLQRLEEKKKGNRGGGGGDLFCQETSYTQNQERMLKEKERKITNAKQKEKKSKSSRTK